jgi:hypothetical protein
MLSLKNEERNMSTRIDRQEHKDGKKMNGHDGKERGRETSK